MRTVLEFAMVVLFLLGAGALCIGIVFLLSSARTRVPPLDTLDEGAALFFMLGAAALFASIVCTLLGFALRALLKRKAPAADTSDTPESR